jgi:hypothetical protein
MRNEDSCLKELHVGLSSLKLITNFLSRKAQEPLIQRDKTTPMQTLIFLNASTLTLMFRKLFSFCSFHATDISFSKAEVLI